MYAYYKKIAYAVIFACALIYTFLEIFNDTSLELWRYDELKFFQVTHSNVRLPRALLSRSSVTRRKNILYWTSCGGPKHYFGTGDVSRDCPDLEEKMCWATYENNSDVKIEDFDAILFYGWHLNPTHLPKTRRQHQNYIFTNLESTERTNIPITPYDKKFFNLTLTYTLDSDIVWTYGEIRSIVNGSLVAPRLRDALNTRRAANSKDHKDAKKGIIRSTWDESRMIEIRKNKTKTAVWFVSNCDPLSGRKKYVKELALHVDVDIYGKCGTEIRCPRNRDCFHELVEPDYYFYLAFENSMCQDYVTEKFYTALKYNVVPVVYGGANYSLFAPPRSYINALDFDSPKQLAIFLKRLIARPREYEKYFDWKKSYTVVDSRLRVICQLCRYLHDNTKNQSYSSLVTWLKKDRCPLQKKLKELPYVTRKNLKKKKHPGEE